MALAAGLGLFSYIMISRRFCFRIFCIAVGPAFTLSDFDRVGGLGSGGLREVLTGLQPGVPNI